MRLLHLGNKHIKRSKHIRDALKDGNVFLKGTKMGSYTFSLLIKLLYNEITPWQTWWQLPNIVLAGWGTEFAGHDLWWMSESLLRGFKKSMKMAMLSQRGNKSTAKVPRRNPGVLFRGQNNLNASKEPGCERKGVMAGPRQLHSPRVAMCSSVG